MQWLKCQPPTTFRHMHRHTRGPCTLYRERRSTYSGPPPISVKFPQASGAGDAPADVEGLELPVVHHIAALNSALRNSKFQCVLHQTTVE